MNELQIFVLAREHRNSEQRSDFLLKATAGDSELLKRVEKLLEFDSESTQIFDRHPQSIVGELETSVHSFSSLSTAKIAHALSDTLSETPNLESIGRLLHYDVIEPIGQGGFGYVLKALDNKLQRDVAIKVLHKRYSELPEAREQFLYEARAAAGIRNDNTVQIYAVEEDPIPFLVMEFIEGTTLQKRIQDHAPLPVDEVLRIGIEIASGLAAAHAKDLVHRDIKPANILLDAASNRAKVTDFGLATTIGEQLNSSEVVLAGTPSFMSPEQARGSSVTHLSDLFSLGSVLYAMATGASPFRARSGRLVMKRVIESAPHSISELNPDLPASLVSVIERLHEKEPQSRIQSATEVVEALSECEIDRVSKNTASKHTVELVGHEPGSSQSPTHASSAFVSGRIAACLIAAMMGCAWIAVRWWPDRTPVAAPSVVSKSVASLPENAPLDIATKAVIEKTEPVVSRAEPVVSRAEPVVSRTEPVVSRTEPVIAKAKPGLTGKALFDQLVDLTDKNNAGLGINSSSFSPTYRDGRLVDLHVIELSDYSSLGALKNLERLILENTDRGTIDLSFTSGTPNLKSLYTNEFEIHSLDALQGLPIEYIHMWNWTTDDPSTHGDLSPIAGLPLGTLNAGHSLVRDLSPLKGMPLGYLCLNRTCVKDLTPLKGMPLGQLLLDHTFVSDLSQIADLPIWELEIGSTRVTDLSPLKGSAIEILRIDDIQVDDLSVLKDMPALRELRIVYDEETSAYLSKLLPNVKLDHVIPTRTYYDLNYPVRNVGLFAMNGTSAKKDSLIERVLEKLLEKNRRLNLDDCQFRVQDGEVVHFEIEMTDDLSPLAELTELQSLEIYGEPKTIDLSFVSNLKKLKSLNVDGLRVASLEPLQGLMLEDLGMWIWSRKRSGRGDELEFLRGMPLKSANLGGSCTSDLSFLTGMPLTFLCLNSSPVHDLEPLKGMKLTQLLLQNTSVHDLSPLKGMPLEELRINRTFVTDLSPLAGMPIRDLNLEGLVIKDRSVIETLPIESLKITCDPVRDRDWILSLKKLKTINGQRVADFLGTEQN